MLRKFVFSFFFLILFSCSQYYRFDELYDKGEFIKAYHLLDNISNKTNAHFQRRFYRVIIKLALDGDSDFIEMLKGMVSNRSQIEINPYLSFGGAYLSYLAAKDSSEYLSVISNLQDIKNVPEEFVVYAYKLRGISHYKLGNYNEAVDDLNKSYRMIPYVDDLYFIGKCFYGLQDNKQAYYYFSRVVQSTQNGFFRGLANFEIGEIFYYEAKYAEALAKYIEAVNYYSKNADCTYKIAKCLEKLKYNRLSPKFYKASLRIQKDYASAWFFLNIN